MINRFNLLGGRSVINSSRARGAGCTGSFLRTLFLYRIPQNTVTVNNAIRNSVSIQLPPYAGFGSERNCSKAPVSKV